MDPQRVAELVGEVPPVPDSELARAEERVSARKRALELLRRSAERLGVGDHRGMLTPEGDALYTRVLLGLPAEWVGGDGVTRSNVRPKRPAAPALPRRQGRRRPPVADRPTIARGWTPGPP